jgi:cytidine deaminase
MTQAKPRRGRPGRNPGRGLTPAERELIAAALAARRRAYAPYSRFTVGAAVRGRDGSVFSGCNVENASFGATVCAERNAVAAAVVGGVKTFRAVAIVTGTSPPSPPCGLCRQVLAEFSPRMAVLLCNPRGEVVRIRLDRLLPMGFSRSFL